VSKGSSVGVALSFVLPGLQFFIHELYDECPERNQQPCRMESGIRTFPLTDLPDISSAVVQDNPIPQYLRLVLLGKLLGRDVCGTLYHFGGL